MNKGCLMVFLSSLKTIRENLLSVKNSIDVGVYEKSMAELEAMKRLMEELAGMKTT